jgi:hypothetical protein
MENALSQEPPNWTHCTSCYGTFEICRLCDSMSNSTELSIEMKFIRRGHNWSARGTSRHVTKGTCLQHKKMCWRYRLVLRSLPLHVSRSVPLHVLHSCLKYKSYTFIESLGDLWFSARTRKCSLLQTDQTGRGTNSASYSMCTRRSFLDGKAARTWTWALLCLG